MNWVRDRADRLKPGEIALGAAIIGAWIVIICFFVAAMMLAPLGY